MDVGTIGQLMLAFDSTIPEGWKLVRDHCSMITAGSSNGIALAEEENLSEIKMDNQGLAPYSLPAVALYPIRLSTCIFTRVTF